jgi:2-desacetyl-2-hydroxyethyl bacteriochlorophyllide A dehydrogenase
MRALVYLGPGRMEVRDVPYPRPDPGEVVIRLVASAICGSDLHAFREATPRRVPPLIMGHESVGVVASAGDEVSRPTAGDRVVLRPILSCGACPPCRAGRTNLCVRGRLVGRDLAGGFAEAVAVPASAAVPIGPDVPDDLATLIEPVANALHVTARSVRPGDAALVLGAGPIGATIVRAALLGGAARVYAADPMVARLDTAAAQDATPLDAVDPASDLLARTDGRGVDVVIDAAGFEATWALALRAVRPGGRIEAVGLGSASGRLEFHVVAGKEASITGSYGWVDDEFARAIELVEAGAFHVRGWFTPTPLDDGAGAFERLVSEAPPYKVVLRP